MRSIKIYHNPQCSKSRQVLSLLEEAEIRPEIILYLEKGLNIDEVTNILNLLQVGIRDIMRSKDKGFIDAKLDDQGISNDILIQALVNDPRLLERPIVIVDNLWGLVCRPPELVSKLLR